MEYDTIFGNNIACILFRFTEFNETSEGHFGKTPITLFVIFIYTVVKS